MQRARMPVIWDESSLHGRELRAVQVVPGEHFGGAVVLFEAAEELQFTPDEPDIWGFDVDPDGGFLFVERDPAAPPVRVHVVLNWFEELEARVPVP